MNKQEIISNEKKDNVNYQKEIKTIISSLNNLLSATSNDLDKYIVLRDVLEEVVGKTGVYDFMMAASNVLVHKKRDFDQYMKILSIILYDGDNDHTYTIGEMDEESEYLEYDEEVRPMIEVAKELQEYSDSNNVREFKAEYFRMEFGLDENLSVEQILAGIDLDNFSGVFEYYYDDPVLELDKIFKPEYPARVIKEVMDAAEDYKKYHMDDPIAGRSRGRYEGLCNFNLEDIKVMIDSRLDYKDYESFITYSALLNYNYDNIENFLDKDSSDYIKNDEVRAKMEYEFNNRITAEDVIKVMKNFNTDYEFNKIANQDPKYDRCYGLTYIYQFRILLERLEKREKEED